MRDLKHCIRAEDAGAAMIAQRPKVLTERGWAAPLNVKL